jgi:uncharacterized LabA/DUF88 family protein
MSQDSLHGQQRFAVLVDADNAQASVVAPLLAEIAKYGIASVKRAYGDWTTSQLAGWKAVLNEHAIQPIQQFGYTTGRNSTDSALIIDALDLLYTGKLNGFCIVSSDSDFTRLATRLRESGVTVLGFGERKTPRAFVTACDKFIYTEILFAERDKPEGEAQPPLQRRSAKELRADTRLVSLLRKAVDSSADEEGWANLATVGTHVAKQAPEFDPRNYGYTKLLALLQATELFEFDERTAKSGHKQHFLRDGRPKKVTSRQSANAT